MKKLTALFVFFAFILSLLAGEMFAQNVRTSVFIVVLSVCLCAFLLALFVLKLMQQAQKQLAIQNKDTRTSIPKAEADSAMFALLKTMTATTEGDLKSARKHLKTLEEIIGKCVLTDILELKILKGEKNFDAVEKLSFKLLKNKDAELVGLKALIETSAKKHNFEEALLSANRAFEARQDLYWVIENAFKLRARSSDWEGALEVLEAGYKKKLISHEKYTLLKAVALYSLSIGQIKNGQNLSALKCLNQACHLSPDFVPAALDLAAKLKAEGQLERAKKTLINIWRHHPTYDVAKAYLALFENESPLEQVLRLENLALLNHKNPSLNNFMLAEYDMKAKLYEKARAEIEVFLINNPATKKLAAMIESYEKRVNHNAKAAENWHKRAKTCADDCLWVCSNCKNTHSKWKPFCSKCGTFNPFDWHLYVKK